MPDDERTPPRQPLGPAAEPGSVRARLLAHDGPLHVRHVELRAEDSLPRFREKLARIVLDEMYQFVALLDARGTLLEVNRAALEGGGIRLDDIQGRPFWEAHWWTVSRETQENLQRDISRAAQGAFVRHDAEVYGGAHGSETIIIDFSLNPVVDHSGAVVFLLAEGRNITEKKRAEAELARKNQELEKLLARVRELDELKSQFFANISHELRTPLALILGPAEKLLAEGSHLSEQQRRELDVIRRNAATLLKHVNGLLDVSKLEAGQMELRYCEVDLARLVRVCASHFEALAPQRGLSYVVDVPPRLPGQVDPEKLERVLLNLLSNAFKFVPPGGRVKLSLSETREGRALLAVQDSGPGVPPEQRQRIFERFQQGEGGATRQFGGTGLGLAITRDFVDLHGGTLTVTDAPGGGALFLAELPLTAPEGVRVRAASEPSPEVDSSLAGTLEELRPVTVSPPTPRQGGAELPRILVVEDNPEMRRFVAESLAEDFQVSIASDGQEGLEQALAHPPDLVVTDIMMPRMSGDQLTWELRKHPALDNVPVLVLSARADDALRLRLLREGAQDYVVKPFSAEELGARARILVRVKRVRELLQRELASQQQDIETLAREVTARGSELRLALEAMRAAREQAERASEIKSTFLRLVSHELRTPLTTIQLQSDLLLRDKAAQLSERQLQGVRRLSASSRRLRELVDSLLEFARVDGGHLPLQRATFDPGALAAEVLEEFRPLAERKGLRLELAGKASGFTSDPRLVRLILDNLVGNALKFTDRGHVRVTLGLEDGGLRLTVEDTGRGIPPEHQARVFEPFEQLEAIRRKHTPGMGLGLALVHRMAEALGGSVQLSSQPGWGSTFTVRLPEAPKPPVEAVHPAGNV